MTQAVFYVLAVSAVITALLCILSRSTISAVLWLTATMLALAAIYLLLNAEFVAAIQVLVYAGAVMVLFLFVVMLLNLSTVTTDLRGPATVAAAVVLVGLLGIQLAALWRYTPGRLAAEVSQSPALADPSALFVAGDVSRHDALTRGVVGAVAAPLFQTYLVPFEITSVLLLAAIVGVVLRRNAIVLFVCIELMLNAVNLSFVALAQLHGASGQIMVFFVMTVAAAEAAVGLAIILAIFRHKQSVDLQNINLLQG